MILIIFVVVDINTVKNTTCTLLIFVDCVKIVKNFNIFIVVGKKLKLNGIVFYISRDENGIFQQV